MWSSTYRDVHSDLLDFANGLEVSLLDRPGHSDTGSDRDSELDARNMSDDGEPSEVDEASDSPIEGSPTDDDQVDADESDGSDEWIGFGASDNELPQDDQGIEIKESETHPSGKYHIAPRCNSNNLFTVRYIPPGLRKESSTSEGEDTVKLTRQLKGLINR